MSASDLSIVIFRNVNDGYWQRLRSAASETIEISERGFRNKASCQQEIKHLKCDKYPSAQVSNAAMG